MELIQDRTFQMRNAAMDALIELIHDIKARKGQGASDAQLATPRDFQRKAQFLLDFVEAENSTGFHAPQEAARLLLLSVDNSRKGQVALRDPAQSAPAAASVPANTAGPNPPAG